MHSVDVHGLTTSSPQAIEGHPESGQELVPNLLTTSSLTLPQNSSWLASVVGKTRRNASANPICALTMLVLAPY